MVRRVVPTVCGESAKRAVQRRNHIVDRPGRRIAGGELMATAAELRCDRSEIE